MKRYNRQEILDCIKNELNLDSVTEKDEMQHTENWDSMGQVSLLLRLEEKFFIKFPADQFANLTSVKKILLYFEEEGVLAND